MAVCAVGCATRHEKIFHLSDKLLLLTTRQIGGDLKKLPHFAGWSRAALLGRLASDEEIGRDAEQLRQRGQLLRADGCGFPFPKSVGAMRNAELGGNLRLCQSRRFP